MAYLNITKIIRDMGFLQYRIAERAGISEHRLSKIINGRAKPTDEEFEKLAAVLGVTVAELKADAS